MYTWGLWGIWLLAVIAAWVLRTRFYAIFMGVNLAICVLVWVGLFGGFARAGVAWMPAVYALQAATFLHYLSLTRPSLRPLWFRGLISIPGLWFAAATWLAFPWAIVSALGIYPYGWWLPFVVCLIGVFQSLRNRREEVLLVLGGDVGKLQRQDIGRPQAPSSAPAEAEVETPPWRLRVVQIADPHVGPFMSPERLRGICERAVETAPDLVLITGDLLTMESQQASERINWALAPLASLPGKVFGCLGNHDHEASQTILSAYESIGATLLVDAMAEVETPIGPVEIIGADFVYRDRRQHLEALFAAVGERSERPRILLLHDPGAFWHVPDGAADLTLSGHSHGGQVGLQSLGIAWTLIGAFTRAPDFGFWGKGHNRLYVHRGNGHYGFPLRLGVSGEESTLHIQFP